MNINLFNIIVQYTLPKSIQSIYFINCCLLLHYSNLIGVAKQEKKVLLLCVMSPNSIYRFVSPNSIYRFVVIYLYTQQMSLIMSCLMFYLCVNKLSIDFVTCYKYLCLEAFRRHSLSNVCLIYCIPIRSDQENSLQSHRKPHATCIDIHKFSTKFV